MNAISKKSTLNIDWATQRPLEAEQKILADTANVLADAIIPPKKSTLTTISDTFSEIKYLVEVMHPVDAVSDKSAKPSLIWNRFMSYTQKVCDEWSKHDYGGYI